MKKLITEKDITDLVRKGIRKLVVSPSTIITPLAADLIKEEQIFVSETTKYHCRIHNFHLSATSKYKSETEKVKDSISFLANENYESDFLKFSIYNNSKKLLKEISVSDNSFGIILTGNYHKTNIMANKFPGVYSVVCNDTFDAEILSDEVFYNLLIIPANMLSDNKKEKIIREVVKSVLKSGIVLDEEIGKIEKSFVKKIRTLN